LLCKNITFAKSKEVETGCKLTESSKESYGSKRAVLAVMMMMVTNASASTLAGCGAVELVFEDRFVQRVAGPTTAS
jgi:hypothetical protein